MKSEDIEKVENIGLAKLKELAEGLTREEFILKYSQDDEFPAALAADQVFYWDKVVKKYPFFKKHNLLVTSRSYEQSSSQATAKYKVSRLKGDSVIDLTGGLGIDSIFISENFKKSWYCEIDSFLCQLTTHNFKKLGLDINTKNADGVKCLNEFDDTGFNWIYIDPSRRVEGKRVVALTDCVPDVTGLMGLFLQKSEKVCIKAAPAYDISMAVKEIKGLYEIAVVSYLGECREVLLFCGRDTVNNITLRSVIVGDEGNVISEFVSFLNEKVDRSDAASIKKYFYVPDPAIFKAGHFERLIDKYNLAYVNNSIGYLSGDEFIKSFPGKVYEVLSEIKWSRKGVIKYLKEKNITSASIARRDFPLDTKGLKKMMSLKDGGEDYLFFTKNFEGKKVCIHCIKK